MSLFYGLFETGANKHEAIIQTFNHFKIINCDERRQRHWHDAPFHKINANLLFLPHFKDSIMRGEFQKPYASPQSPFSAELFFVNVIYFVFMPRCIFTRSFRDEPYPPHNYVI